MADMALTALSFMGQRGPAGAMLEEMRQYFHDHPDHLRELARYSLESSTLLTPTVVPLSEKKYDQYEHAIREWMALRDRVSQRKGRGRIGEQDIEACTKLHQALLQQMKQCPYVSYQECVILWVMLFPVQSDQKIMADRIKQDYGTLNHRISIYAQKFIKSLSTDLRDLKYLKYLRDLILTQEIASSTCVLFPTRDSIRDRDLLTILMGRILWLQDQNKVGSEVESEVQRLADVALRTLATQPVDEEVKRAALDVIRYLPAQTVGEINFVLQIANGTNDQALLEACAYALQYARPMDNVAWNALERGRNAAAEVVKEAVEQALKGRK